MNNFKTELAEIEKEREIYKTSDRYIFLNGKKSQLIKDQKMFEEFINKEIKFLEWLREFPNSLFINEQLKFRIDKLTKEIIGEEKGK